MTKRISHVLIYLVFRLVVALFYLLPFSLMYVLSDGIAALLHRVIGYRKAVVLANLERCFPEKTAQERADMLPDVYRNVSDILLEAIKGFSMSRSMLERRYCYQIGPDIAPENLPDGSCIIMGSHIANWEWGVITWPLAFRQTIIGVYKPLTNPLIERFAAKVRTQFGHVLADLSYTREAFGKYSKAAGAFVMLSDQNPTRSDRADWVTFFGHDTACLHGADRYARRYGLPVFYMATRRTKRGHYLTTCELLCASPAATAEGEITRLFMQKLESSIREKPADWLWSHRRWKHQRASIPHTAET